MMRINGIANADAFQATVKNGVTHKSFERVI
jgi:hypothetical protein